MNIAEAARTVLRDSGKPMHVDEIYEQIIHRGLYIFGAKNPKRVMSQASLERSDANLKAKQVMFKLVSQGTFELAN
jgi:hypothetical protein